MAARSIGLLDEHPPIQIDPVSLMQVLIKTFVAVMKFSDWDESATSSQPVSGASATQLVLDVAQFFR